MAKKSVRNSREKTARRPVARERVARPERSRSTRQEAESVTREAVRRVVPQPATARARFRDAGGALAKFGTRAAALAARATRRVSESIAEGANRVQVMGFKGIQTPARMRKIENSRLLHVLSEFLAVERGATQLYARAYERARHPRFREFLQKYMQQTERHASVLEFAVRELGGDVNFVSPAAKVQQQRVNAFMRLDSSASAQELLDIETVLLTETKVHSDWSFLRLIVPYLKDKRAREVMGRVVEEIEEEKDQHLIWARESLTDLMLREVFGPFESARRAA